METFLCDVLCTGTFNVLHAGHVQLIEYASQFGKVTIGINSDRYLYSKYGKDKTIKDEYRKYMLESIKYVDSVVIFNEDNPSALIRKLKPKIYVRGPDYKNKSLIEQAALDEVGSVLIIYPAGKIFNASDLINLF